MAKVTFSLSSKLNKDFIKSELLIRFSGGRGFIYRAKTGVFVSPDRWNNTKGQIILPKLHTPEQKELAANQEVLDTLKNDVIQAFLQLDKDTIGVDENWLKNYLDKRKHPDKYISKNEAEEVFQPVTLLTWVDSFIACAGNRQTREGHIISPNSTKQYKVAQLHLTGFATAQEKKDFTFSDINKDFYDKYIQYLQKLDLSANTIGKEVKNLKVMVNALPRNLRSQCDITEFHILSEDVDNVYLDEAELQMLKDCDLLKTPYLDRVRDWFLLLAWTGCRFSDLIKINKENIRDGVITYRQQKTNNKVSIPLHPIVTEILEKYDYQLPKPISNQRFNEFVKDVTEKAGITQDESITRTIGGKLTTEHQPKFELISSHTGRRSFATNMYKRGLPTLMIMSITGHKTEKSFLKYIKVKQSEHAEMMAKAWKDIYK